MGKIFGISDNPVSTITSALQGVRIEAPKVVVSSLLKNTTEADKFVSKTKQPQSNAFIKMRNGFGKLMAHFSHPNKVQNKIS